MEILLVIVGIVIYFIPYFIGSDRRNSAGIFILNLFLGWTLIGWVGALIWALVDDKKITYSDPSKFSQLTGSSSPTGSSSVDQIVKLASLRDSGAITEAEYQKEKQKILNS